MRRRRTMYLDDARHYYLYVFEPPMTMEEAWLRWTRYQARP